MPALSILLPVRDAEPWIAASAASLARQTWSDYEVIAVNDGSRDGSGEWLEHQAARDPRWRVFHTPPRGLPLTLNTALSHAQAPRIARHDADDLSHRERFALQLAFLREHPRVSVVGSRVRLFPRAAVGNGMKRWALWHNRLLTHEAMAAEAYLDSPLAHGCAMVRRSALESVGGWQERGWAEDLDLWLRLLAAGARFAKLPATLYGWRQHPDSATWRDPRYTQDRFVALRLTHLRRGPLRGARRACLVGVGASLTRWSEALARHGVTPDVHARGRPTPELVRMLTAPVVLVFMSVEARQRWREALVASDMTELRDFVFVA